jgi:hypothetical protein
MKDRARRQQKTDKVDLYYRPKEFRASAKSKFPLSTQQPFLADFFSQPFIALFTGLIFGLIIGIAGTLITAVANVDLLDHPLQWAVNVVSWFR